MPLILPPRYFFIAFICDLAAFGGALHAFAFGRCLIHSGGRLRRYTARALAVGFGFGRCLCVGLPDSGSRRRWLCTIRRGRCLRDTRAAFGLWRGALALAVGRWLCVGRCLIHSGRRLRGRCLRAVGFGFVRCRAVGGFAKKNYINTF